MAWSSGLFRLWIFLSVNWIVASFWYLGPSQFDLIFNMGYIKYEFMENEVIYTNPNLSDEELGIFFLQKGKEFTEKNYANCLGRKKCIIWERIPSDPMEELKARSEFIKLVREGPEELRKKFFSAVSVLFFPPLVLFAFGAFFLWMVRGFKKKM